MKVDVCILAGGKGTRLAPVWGATPKCLAPVRGVPILQRLLDQLAELDLGRVVVSVGHRAHEVYEWYWSKCPYAREARWMEVTFVLDHIPGQGTLPAVRQALAVTQHPLLVVNGDTLPLGWSFAQLVHRAKGQYGCSAWVELPRTEQTFTRRYCGATILFSSEKIMLKRCKFTLFEMFAETHTKQLTFPPERGGFLDIGTPEGFAAAQHYRGA